MGVFELRKQRVRAFVRSSRQGMSNLLDFHSMPDSDLERLAILLKQIVAESKITRQPPEKWAIFKRFRVADEHSPLIVQIREYLMDLFAYRDDSHLSAARPHFNRGRDRLAGAWLALERGARSMPSKWQRR